MAYLVLTNVYLEARGVTFPAASHTQETIVYDFSSAPEITRRWPMRWRCSGICREAREGTQLQPALYERVLATCRSVANVRAQANALLGLGQVAYELGDWNRTKAWANQTLEFALDHGFKSIAVAGMHLLGIVDEHEHRMSAAYDRLSECDALARSMGPRGRWWVVMGLPALARVVGAQGDLVQASRLGAETAMLARGLGDLQASRGLSSHALGLHLRLDTTNVLSAWPARPRPSAIGPVLRWELPTGDSRADPRKEIAR